MIFNRRLLETEQRAIKAVDDVVSMAEQSFDTGFRMALCSECKPPHETERLSENPLDELVDMLDTYFQKACREAAAHFRAMLYKILYQNWKKTLPDSVEPQNLVDWVEDLPEAVREATRAKVRRIMASLVSIQKVHLYARQEVGPTLQKFRERAHELVERQADYILEPQTNDTEKMDGLERMEMDALAYIHRQLLTQLKADQKEANRRLYQAMTELFKESINLQGYAQSLQKWADNTLMSM